MRRSQWEYAIHLIIPIWLSLLSFEASMLADTGCFAQASSPENWVNMMW